MSDANALSGLASGGYFREKLYVFAVNIAAPQFDAAVVTTYLKDARNIDEWAHYIPGVFLIRSKQDAYLLGNSLRNLVGGAFCLLIEAHAGNSNGWLPQPAWEWINQTKAERDANAINALLEAYPGPKK